MDISPARGPHPFAQFVNPELARLLSDLKMDKTFVRGSGCLLYDVEGREYLDCIASYGALPFGFNPPEIWEALLRAKDALEPSFVQPSYLDAAGELARKLIEVAPPSLKYVTFANSGAEAVEAALKAARAATGRKKILATHNSFHGKTFGALSATGKPSYQKAFGAPAEGFDYIPFGDTEALAATLDAQPSEYAAFIVEPIQGEGGIVEPPPGYLRQAREICDRHGTLLIVDEVQTGLGRTGTMFCCEQEGVAPDIMVLAKALGGGLMPIGACLLSDRAYTEEFAMKHSSTFAGNALACRAGVAALSLLTRDNRALLDNVRARGQQLKAGLEEIKRRYPGPIRSVRGRGLMLGIEFPDDREGLDGSLLGIMAEQEMLTPVISSFLLNVTGIRVAPTLNGANVIRVEPPLIITKEQCDRALEAFERVVEILSRKDTAALTAHLVCEPARWATITSARTTKAKKNQEAGPAPSPLVATPARPAESSYGEGGPYQHPKTPGRVAIWSVPGDPADEGRFGFLVHPLYLKNYTEYDESLASFAENEMKELANLWNSMADPFVVGTATIRSAAGARARGEFVVVPRTSEELLAMDRSKAVALIAGAVRLAADRGARIVGLGAYTSVVTRGGHDLLGLGIPITTGNSYAAVTAVEAAIQAFSRLGSSLQGAAGAILGATGSIGKATATLLSEEVNALYLIGNPGNPERSLARLRKVSAEICRHLLRQLYLGRRFRPNSLGDLLRSWPSLPGPDAPASEYDRLVRVLCDDSFPIVISVDAARCLPDADLIISATSSVQTLIEPAMVRPGAVICDVSRPSNVSPRLAEERPDVLVIDGGIVEVPGRPYLGWNFGFEPGLAYACMAETMMLALERRYENMSIGGDLSEDSLSLVRALAQKHGFKLAGFRSFDRPLPDHVWDGVKAARRRAIQAGRSEGSGLDRSRSWMRQ